MMDKRANLSPAQRALLEKRIKGKAGPLPQGNAKKSSIPRRPEGEAPLSFAQERIWVMEQLELGSAAYNIPIAVTITGDLDHAILTRTINEIIRRHEALRTTFHFQGGQPTAHILDELTVSVHTEDIRSLPSAARNQEAERLAVAEATRLFDLRQGPLLRATTIRKADDEHLLVIILHHIIADGWTVGILIREFAIVYGSFVQGQPSPLPELPIQYSDFAHWQKLPEQQQALIPHRDYWKKQLGGTLEPLNLPTDRPRPSVQTYTGTAARFLLSEALTESLRKLSLEAGTTLFMTLTAAFQTFLARYTGQTDISVGSPIANRNREELESLVGVFINTLVIRSQVEDSLTFRDLLQNVRRTTLDAYAHQDMPFEKLVEELQPDRNMAFSPLFQVMFILQTSPMAFSMPGLSMKSEMFDTHTAKFDITLSFFEEEQGLLGHWEYNTDLFDEATVRRMIGHFQILLAAVADNPDQLLHQLPLLPHEEQQRMLGDWNDTAVPSREACLHQLFEAQVERTPDATALVFEDQKLTFRELNNRANHVAQFLQALGVGPDDRVGIYMERSPEMMTALLAAHKAGGAYLPLDPSYPQERLAFMIQDAKPKVILTQPALAHLLPPHDAQVLTLTGEEPSAFLPNPTSLVQPEHLAYVIYTSGSTGTPKGVMVEHRSAAHFCTGMDDVIGCGPEDTILGVTSIGFDISVVELFWTLTRGAQVVLLSEQEIVEAGVSAGEHSLRRQLLRHNVTLLQCTPSLMGMITHTPEGLAALQGLQKIFLGGEALPVALARQLKQHTNARLFNVYGPTEATVYAAHYEVQDTDLSTIPLGRPVPNYTLYILDKHLQPVPIGVAGELHIGGAGVTRGYLGRPELTEERFINNPFGAGKLYKTGDLASYLPDGTVKFLGRLDHQVKVRGYRIELGEIETRLSEHDSIREGVVIARNNSLTAYVVTEGSELPDGTALRSFLRETLPEYMVPSTFLPLDAMPLTPSGKVDRKALAASVGEAVLSPEQSFVPPSTPLEAALAAIWSDVLRVEQVGVQDNFFTLGGHSLLATQLVSRVISDAGLTLTLRDVFNNPTVRDMARFLQDRSADTAAGHYEPIPPASRDADLPLSFAQERLWFLDQLQPNTAVYNIAAALRLQGPLDADALLHSFQQIVRRHEALRTTFQIVNGQPVQIISDDAQAEMPVINVSDEAEARTLASEEAEKPFDLQHGPLVRAKLLRVGAEDHLLLLTLHHIITDEWSMGIFVDEMVKNYGDYAAGKTPLHDELPIQYADYAAWQREWLRGDVLQNQLAYWKQQLGGELPVLQLPTDYLRPAVQTDSGATLNFALNETLAGKLNQLSRQEGATLYMTLLAAFNTLLYRYTGQDDILIGSPIAGRGREELEGLIGFFVNTLVLRTDLSGAPSFRQLLARVRQTAFDAYAHQDVPFEKLVGELQPKRHMSYSPLFQAMFALQNAPKGTLEVQGLTLTPQPLDNGTAKFDLSLTVIETGGGLQAGIEYNTDLFAPDTIRRMAEHFTMLLESIVERPDAVLGDLRLLTAEEEGLLLDEWAEIQAPAFAAQCLHHRFEAQAARTPDAEAVVCGTERLTYGELNARANQLAHYLQAQGVTPETLVALSVDRTPMMVITVLAVLKAGGAYVPIDPTYPVERIATMLSVCHPPLLLTDQPLALAADGTTRVIDLGAAAGEIAAQPTVNPTSPVQPHNLAYVIFTSGTTGVPKGVMVQHDTLDSNRAIWHEKFELDAYKRGLQYASMSFDVFVDDLIRNLLTGGALVICPHDIRLDIAALYRLLQDEQITVFNSTPGLIIPLMEYVWQNNLPIDHLQLLLPGADALASSEYAVLLERFGDRMRIANCFGITEVTIDSSTFEAKAGEYDPHRFTTVPIGRPNANTRMYILDEQMNPVPVGIAGELYVGGAGVARGYYNRPDLTAERFLPNPFVPGERFYKTSDMARWLPDGNVQYLGRLDHQVKLRGFRIELGEIEAVLNDHPSIFQSVAAVFESDLTAYYTGEDVSPAELRTFVKERLPSFMVPAHFMHLDQLPLSPNGKIDRRLLPAPAAGERANEYVAPRTPTEAKLAAIWSELLRVEEISVHDNFFDLGGHSLMATQMVTKVQSELGVALNLRDLFEKTTIAELAVEVEAAESVAAPVYKRLDRVGSKKRR